MLPAAIHTSGVAEAFQRSHASPKMHLILRHKAANKYTASTPDCACKWQRPITCRLERVIQLHSVLECVVKILNMASSM